MSHSNLHKNEGEFLGKGTVGFESFFMYNYIIQ